jgi:hypothetical protein
MIALFYWAVTADSQFGFQGHFDDFPSCCMRTKSLYIFAHFGL